MGLPTVKVKSYPCRELLQERIFTPGQIEGIMCVLHGEFKKELGVVLAAKRPQ